MLCASRPLLAHLDPTLDAPWIQPLTENDLPITCVSNSVPETSVPDAALTSCSHMDTHTGESWVTCAELGLMYAVTPHVGTPIKPLPSCTRSHRQCPERPWHPLPWLDSSLGLACKSITLWLPHSKALQCKSQL